MKGSEMLAYFEQNPNGILQDEEGNTYQLDQTGNVVDRIGSRFLMNVHIEADLVSKQE